MPVSAPVKLWQHLGTVGTRQPFIPTPAELETWNRIRIPWPGLDRNGKPYPEIWGLNFGRRAGKTTMLEKFLWAGLLQQPDWAGPPVVKVTADTEEHAMLVWRPFIWHLENTPLVALKVSYDKEYHLVTIANGATVQLISAHNPQAMAGSGVTLWIVDEAQYFTLDAWANMFPSVSDRNGIILMAGVSEGEGPFKEVCLKGDDDDYPLYGRVHFPSTANPFLTKHALEAARAELGEKKFAQLYLAEWQAELGHIFTNVDGCILRERLPINVDRRNFAYVEPPRRGMEYYGGLDLGRHGDWTVHTIWNSRGRLVAWDRFTGLGWENQKQRIQTLHELYFKPPTAADETGIGDPIVEDLIVRGLNVIGVKITTNAEKRRLVDELAVRISSGMIEYPRIEQFIRELKRMEAKKASEHSRVIVYEAPAGMHDDFVISACLAQDIMPRPSSRVATMVKPRKQDIDPGPKPAEDYWDGGRQRSAYEYI